MPEQQGEFNSFAERDAHITEQLSDWERRQAAAAKVPRDPLAGVISVRHNPDHIFENKGWFRDEQQWSGETNGVRRNRS